MCSLWMVINSKEMASSVHGVKQFKGTKLSISVGSEGIAGTEA